MDMRKYKNHLITTKGYAMLCYAMLAVMIEHSLLYNCLVVTK